ncbi:flavin monoamine oxidase family protein [Sphingomonas natans]|uniref:flavin monoamine oxidase family protein n=1 Tax=Sphingomonas natans TaxID=3063330 RepID=UPI0026E1209D|nr:NAD(P)/FAD-dependent oxidoreductase [Sphingomonas sp. BIUV-7]
MSGIDVAIVGAGAAGIAAARRLANRGRSVLLIDALPRIGGRAHTLAVDGVALDMGCGWLHSAERNPWVGVAEALDHAIDRSRSAWGDQWRNLGFSTAEQHEAGAAFEAWNEAIRAGVASDRASDALDPASPWAGFVEALSSYINGAQLGELSVADYLAYDDAASETNWRLPGGYGALIAGAAGDVPRALGTRVASVAHTDAGVRLTTDQGEIDARAAIVTVSTEMLAAGAIRLPSAFDTACHAATKLPLGLADKLFFRVPEPNDLPENGHLLGSPRRAATGSYYLRPFGHPVIEVFLGGAAARALESEGDGAAEAFAREELGALLGSDFARRLDFITGSAWAKCETIRGSYSHALPGCADARADLAQPVDERILLAGEACSAKDFTTAHGAYETGIAAADRLDATLAALPCTQGGD